MSTPEGKVKRQVSKVLRTYAPKVYYFMPVQGGYGSAALDYHGACEGRAFAIETKAPGKKLTPRQEATKRDMEAAGMKVFVVGEKEIVVDINGCIRITYSGMVELEAWLLGLLS